MQPTIASGATIATAGVRNGRAAARVRPAQHQSPQSATIAKANKRARVRIIGELADRQEGGGEGHDDAGERGDDVRRVELRVDRREAAPEAGRRAP